MSGENNKYIRSNHKASIINQGDRKTRARGQCEFHYSLFFSRKKIPRFGKECAKNGFAFHAICVCLQRRNLKGPRAKKDGLILRASDMLPNFFYLHHMRKTLISERDRELWMERWSLDGERAPWPLPKIDMTSSGVQRVRAFVIGVTQGSRRQAICSMRFECVKFRSVIAGHCSNLHYEPSLEKIWWEKWP